MQVPGLMGRAGLVCAAASVCVVVAELCPVHTRPASRSWTAVAVGGDVREVRAAVMAAIAPGHVFVHTPQIVTGTDGRLALLAGEEIVVLDPETQLEFVTTASPTHQLQANQRIGGVFYSLRHGDTRALSIQTPTCRIDARGGALLVTAQRGFSTVHVKSGTARIASRDWAQPLALSAGDTLLARMGNKPRVLRAGEDVFSVLGRRWGRRVERQMHRYSRMNDEISHVRKVIGAARRARATAAARPAPPPPPRRQPKEERAVHPLTEAEFAKQFMSPFFEESLPEVDEVRRHSDGDRH